MRPPRGFTWGSAPRLRTAELSSWEACRGFGSSAQAAPKVEDSPLSLTLHRQVGVFRLGVAEVQEVLANVHEE